MKYVTREGVIVNANDGQDNTINRMYNTAPGRFLTKMLIRPEISNIGGAFLSTRASCLLIKPFIKKNNIDMSVYEKKKYTSYNDFFTRRAIDGAREFDREPSHLVSPCDSKLSAYTVHENGLIRIKGCDYTIESLLRDEKLAKRYLGGTMLVFRLTVDDYHRFFYIDNGRKSSNRSLRGFYHTVNPIALDSVPVFRENHRTYSILASENFGRVLMMEVGALMVGKIKNKHEACRVKRGCEKGYFEFGGSTVVLIFEKDKIRLDADIQTNIKNNLETIVRAGEKIGTRK